MANPKTTEKPVGTLFTIDNKGLKRPVVICSGNNHSKTKFKRYCGVPQLELVLYKYLGNVNVLVWLPKEMVNNQYLTKYN